MKRMGFVLVLVLLSGCAAGPSDGPGSGTLEQDGAASAITVCSEENTERARVIMATNARGDGLGIIIPHDGGAMTAALFQGDAGLGPCEAVTFSNAGDAWIVDATCFEVPFRAEIHACELAD